MMEPFLSLNVLKNDYYRCVSFSLFRYASRSIAWENYDGNAIIRIRIPRFAQMKIRSLAPGFGWFKRDGNSYVRIKSDKAHFLPNCFRCLRVTHKTTNMADKGRFFCGRKKEVVAFLTLVKEKQITAILDSKQQRNASIYQELRVEICSRGFDKPWTALLENLRELVVFTKVRTFDGKTHDTNFF